MAQIYPDNWQQLQLGGHLGREVDTLALFARHLPDEYEVFHQVHWISLNDDRTGLNEADFIIINRAGHVLLLEQRSGWLNETPEQGLQIVTSGRRRISVQSHLAELHQTLTARLGALLDQPPLIEILFYCPDYSVQNPGSAGLPPQRIIDVNHRDTLCTRIRHILPTADDTDSARRVRRFFIDELKLVPEVNAIRGHIQQTYTRLSSGLNDWARQISMPCFRLRITGTAGCGKTQLALNICHDTLSAGKRVLYVCFNRPLAEHFATIAPQGTRAVNFHQLCDHLAAAHGIQTDFSRPDAFTALEQRCTTLPIPAEWQFDEIIIDEGQDFQSHWLTLLERMQKPAARWWWLEDPLQNLYPNTAPPDLSGWVTLHCRRNYRTPADIVHWLNRILQLPQQHTSATETASDLLAPVESGCPFHSPGIIIDTWNSEHSLIEKTRHAITRCISQGFKREMIAIITFRGWANSAFKSLERLGNYTLRSFQNSYDLLGNPIYNDGEFLIDSVYRFKGQAAPCIILTEVDFDAISELVKRKLFVGLTRASIQLVVIASERAAQQLPVPENALMQHITQNAFFY